MLRELQRTGTMTAAAAALNYTHSAVSQQLAQLEKDVGYPLFLKRGRRVELTEQGDILAGYAHKLLTLADQAEADLAMSEDHVTGILRVASFPTMVATAIPRVMKILRKKHPLLEIRISLAESEPAMDKLFTRDCDLVLDEDYEGYSAPLPAGLHREALFLDPLHVVAPTHGPWSGARELSDLAEASWVLDPVHLGPGLWARAQCRQAGFEPKVQFESVDPLLFKHLVKEGYAAAFLPELLLAEEKRSGGDSDFNVIALPGNPSRALYTTVLEGKQEHPAIQAFRTAMRQGLEIAMYGQEGKLLNRDE